VVEKEGQASCVLSSREDDNEEQMRRSKGYWADGGLVIRWGGWAARWTWATRRKEEGRVEGG
jgi:hypothetical protein